MLFMDPLQCKFVLSTEALSRIRPAICFLQRKRYMGFRNTLFRLRIVFCLAEPNYQIQFTQHLFFAYLDLPDRFLIVGTAIRHRVFR